MVLFLGLFDHLLIAGLALNGRVEDLFFQFGVDFKLGDGVICDPFSRLAVLCFVELAKHLLNASMVLAQHGERVHAGTLQVDFLHGETPFKLKLGS